MSTFYVSFGQDHVHRLGDITLDKDILLKITALDGHVARERAFKALGRQWSMLYTEETVQFEYFPRGFVEVPSI